MKKSIWIWISFICIIIISFIIYFDLKSSNNPVEIDKNISTDALTFGKTSVNIISSNDNSIEVRFTFYTNKFFHQYNINSVNIIDESTKKQIMFKYDLLDRKSGSIKFYKSTDNNKEYKYVSDPIVLNLFFPFQNYKYPFGEQRGFLQISLIDTCDNKEYVPDYIRIFERDVNLDLISGNIVMGKDITKGFIGGSFFEIRLGRPKSYAIISLIVLLSLFIIATIIGVRNSKVFDKANIYSLIGLLIGIPVFLEMTYIGPENAFTLQKLLGFVLCVYIIIIILITLIQIPKAKK